MTDNLSEKNSIFEQKVSSALNTVAPMKVFQVRKNFKNWVDLELKNLMTRRDQTRELARRNDDFLHWQEYRKLRNECTKMLKKKKNDYMAAIFDSHRNKNDAKNIYKSTKELLGVKNAGQPSCLLVDAILVKKPKMIANALQSFFHEKIQKIVKNLKKTEETP